MLDSKEKLSGAVFLKMKRPCIYAWFRNGECLYVGCSMQGMSRILDNEHAAMGGGRFVLPTDEFRIKWFKDATQPELIAMEAIVIKELDPLLNVYRSEAHFGKDLS